MNIHNLAQKTTWMLGSNKLELFQVYLQEFSLPGVSFNHPEVYSRPSSKVYLVADSITYNNLSTTILLDENYKVYFELMQKVLAQFNPETGAFSSQVFDLFVILQDQKGHDIFKVNFNNARISSIGDISLSTQGDEPYNTLTVDFVYDYYTIENLERLASEGINFN